MAWILNCVSRIGWLNRMTQFKDKLVQGESKCRFVYLSKFDGSRYSSLQATHVPVGADQNNT